MTALAAQAYFRRLGCLGLGGRQAVAAMIGELPSIVPDAQAVVAWTAPDGGLKDMWIGEIIPSVIDLFFNHHHLFVGPTEPSLEMLACAPAPMLRMSDRFAPDLIERSNTYQQVFRPYRIGEMFSMPLRHAGKPIGMFCCYRQGGERPFDADEQARLLSLAPFVRHAMLAAEEVWDMVETDERGVVFCDPDGRIRHQTATAQRLLFYACNDRLGVGETPVDLAASMLPEKLRPLCQAFAGVVRGEPAPPPRMSVANAWGEFEIVAQSLQSGHAAADPLDPICLIIARKQPLPLHLASRLRGHRLSERQQQLALHLALDRPVDDILGRMGIGAHTYRDYVRRVYAGLGVSNRAQLLGRLLS
jgi:DNA-binding CsgD family transcriptional regulator